MNICQQVDRSFYLTDLARFVGQFESEEILLKAIETLLTKMPNVSGVRRTHGAHEIGKDIVFYGRGGLSETCLYACVLKNKPITGNVDSSHGARTVCLQVEQALDTPVLNSKGDSERVEHIYVMCPHEMSPAALTSVQGKLRAGSPVTFFCGRMLLKLFEDYWPEFLIFDSNLLPAYLKSLQTVLENNADLRNVVLQHNILADISKNISDVYVKPRFKQELQEFQLADTPIPNISEIEDLITIQRTKELADELIATSTILSTLSLERENVHVPRTRQMAEDLHLLASQLVKEWNEAYRPHSLRPAVEMDKHTGGRRGKIRYGTGDGQQTVKKSEMALQLKNCQGLREKCVHIIQEAAPIIDEFRARVARANAFVAREHSEPIGILQTDDYRIFCSIQEHSRLNPRVLAASPVQNTLDFSEDLLSRHSGPLLITGPAGFGKTTLCKWNTIRDAERFVRSESSIFPVFVPLHQFAQGSFGTIEETFLKPPEVQNLIRSKKAEKDPSFRVRLYLDGLDEIPSIKRQNDLLELARNFMASERNVDIVLTAREHVFGLGWLARVRLRELDQAGIQELVSNWLDHNDSEVKAFFEQLSAVPPLERLMEIPLLASLIISVYRKNKKLPESKVRLYKMFAELLSGGWDLAKDVKRNSQFGANVKLGVLGNLGKLVHFSEKRQFEQLVFKTAIKNTLPTMAGQWDILLNELVQDGLLTPIGSNYTFRHHSFQEYFAAQDLCDPSGRKQAQVLRWFLKGDDWWREVLAFYVGMAPNPADLKSWVRTESAHVASVAAVDISERQQYLHSTIDEYYPPVPLTKH